MFHEVKLKCREKQGNKDESKPKSPMCIAGGEEQYHSGKVLLLKPQFP